MDLLILLAREHSRGDPSRIKHGLFLSYIKRWSGIICVALQRAVADSLKFEVGTDINSFPLEPIPSVSELHYN